MQNHRRRHLVSEDSPEATMHLMVPETKWLPNASALVNPNLFGRQAQPSTAQRCRSETDKNIFEDLFSSVLSQFKEYHPSQNLKFNNLGIFLSLKLRNLMEKILRISLKLNFTQNTLVCYGFNVNIDRTSAYLG